MRTAELGFPMALRSAAEKEKAKARGKKLQASRSADSVDYKRGDDDDFDMEDVNDE
jgi:hypothetical protein